MAAFQWTNKAQTAAFALADGYTREEAAVMAGIGERTLYRWLALPEFSEEVDRLVFLTGIARKSERLKITKRIARNLGDTTEKDLLDWLKFAQSETDGAKLDLTSFLKQLTEQSTAERTDDSRLAGSGSGGMAGEPKAGGDTG